MLADQRLWHAQCIHQFMDAALGFAQLQHNGDSYGCSQRTQQFAGGVENLPWRRRGVFEGPVLVTRAVGGRHRGRHRGGHHHE